MKNTDIKIRQSIWVATFAICVSYLCSGCNRSTAESHDPNRKLRAVATISIIGDWVRTIGGDDVELTTLVGADSDPHEYEPVPSDNIALAQTDIIFENGLGLENWLDKLYISSRSRATRITITSGIDVRHARATEAGKLDGRADDVDPHAWQDVRDALIMVKNIETALTWADPRHAPSFRARSADYLIQLSELDTWVAEQIESLPPARRKLVTSHDAFGYFGQRYGVGVTRSALESVTSEASDPSAKRIAEVVARIKSDGVPVIFLENMQNPKLMNQIAHEANVKVAPALYSDALGQPGSAGDTYLKMFRYNVNTMVKALSQ